MRQLLKDEIDPLKPNAHTSSGTNQSGLLITLSITQFVITDYGDHPAAWLLAVSVLTGFTVTTQIILSRYAWFGYARPATHDCIKNITEGS